MDLTNPTYAPLRVFVDELARCGVRHACASPGSRSAPLVISLADEVRVRVWNHVDERSSGFFALGLALATGAPVVVACTSGTAAANLHPAVVEAFEARVPLIVLTADRPPELREIGAGQAIDQIRLYGSAAKWFCEVGSHDPTGATLRHFRQLACRACATAVDGRPGPVHLNFGLREPLAPVQQKLEIDDPLAVAGRPDGDPWTEVRRPRGSAWPGLADEVTAAERGVIVCGRQTDERLPGAVATLAAAAGYPVLAEPTSGSRAGRHDTAQVVAAYDALLRDEAFAGAFHPDLVIRCGDAPTSKPLCAWLARPGIRQVVLDPDASWSEPTRTAAEVVRADAPRTLEYAARGPGRGAGAWLEGWLKAERRAQGAIDAALAAVEDPFFEPRVYRELAAVLPAGSTVTLSSSMPVRDVEAFVGVLDRPVRFLSNRGANGIDGVVSTAFGVAAASPGRSFLFTGDLALVHDMNGLLAARRHGLDLTVVLVDNDGGGIFSFLPIAEHPEHFEEQIGTPTGLDFRLAAELHGLSYVAPGDYAELRDAVAGARGATLVHVRTDRARNVEQHLDVWRRVSAAIA